jgi:hypothetical protein
MIGVHAGALVTAMMELMTFGDRPVGTLVEDAMC